MNNYYYNKDLHNASLNSISKRIYVQNYQKPESLPLERPIVSVRKEEQKDGTIIGALNCYKKRLGVTGGFSQQDRMIYDKRRAFDRALLYSYQGANIIRAGEKAEDQLDFRPNRALINSDKLKQDYDDKILSVGYEYNFQPGDVFEWLGTNTYWLIYLQDLTELAYFRGNIRKCSYEIDWEDENGKHTSYAAVRGPVETKIDYIQKHSISVDRPNYSLNILIPKNEDTLSYFKRYAKFYLKNIETCWRVEAIDWISMPGVLEINATEYYANSQEDDDGVVGNLIVKPKDPNTIIENAAISGETFIKPKKVYKYITTVDKDFEWKIDSKLPVKMRIDGNNPKICEIQWTMGISGQFELSYGDYSKTIVVESLF